MAFLQSLWLYSSLLHNLQPSPLCLSPSSFLPFLFFLLLYYPPPRLYYSFKYCMYNPCYSTIKLCESRALTYLNVFLVSLEMYMHLICLPNSILNSHIFDKIVDNGLPSITLFIFQILKNSVFAGFLTYFRVSPHAVHILCDPFPN